MPVFDFWNVLSSNSNSPFLFFFCPSGPLWATLLPLFIQNSVYKFNFFTSCTEFMLWLLVLLCFLVLASGSAKLYCHPVPPLFFLSLSAVSLPHCIPLMKLVLAVCLHFVSLFFSCNFAQTLSKQIYRLYSSWFFKAGWMTTISACSSIPSIIHCLTNENQKVQKFGT